MARHGIRQLGLWACLGLLLVGGPAPADARQINLAPTPDQDGTGQQTDPNSLAGSWLGALTDDQGQRHNLTLILSESAYTWSDRCNEMGTYAVNGDNITFTAGLSDCSPGLAGGAQVAVSEDPADPSQSYRWSRQDDTITIHGVPVRDRVVDLKMTMTRVEVLKVIGRGVLSVIRFRDSGRGGWDQVIGDISFSIHRGPDADVVAGEGKLNYVIHSVAMLNDLTLCTMQGTATGKAVLTGRFYSEPACELSDLVVSNDYWGPVTITALEGQQCGGVHVGDTFPDWAPAKSNWMSFPLVAGEVAHRALMPDTEDYILTEIQVDLDATGCVAAP